MDDEGWKGIPFADLDCRHWLPFLSAEVLGQENPKLVAAASSDMYATDWALPPENKEAA